jgi:hypothetical protein
MHQCIHSRNSLVQRLDIKQRAFNTGYVLALQPSHVGGRSGNEEYLVSVFEKNINDMAANKTGGTRDEDLQSSTSK